MGPANPHKFIYHLSDDMIHDPAMVDVIYVTFLIVKEYTMKLC